MQVRAWRRARENDARLVARLLEVVGDALLEVARLADIEEAEGADLLKIDIQGAELMVLDGMTGRLPEIDALVIETSTIATVKGGAEVRDVVSFLGDHGFVLADIVGLRRRPLDDATAQLDLLFVPHDKSLRMDRRWAASA